MYIVLEMSTYIIDFETGICIYILFLLIGLAIPISKIIIEIIKDRT